MLFNSYGFIFLFLPLTLALFFAAARVSEAAAKLTLIAASVLFYGWWNPVYVPLLALLMLFTYVVGQRLSERPSRALLGFGVAVLLGALGYFKYAGFLVANIDALTGANWAVGTIVLPLAISFFTFQKIAYLVDSHRGLTRDTGFLDYALFVVFFPQLIAGPIVHWKEILPQFRLPETFRPHAENIAVGTTIFAIGLFKKAVLADGIAVHATPVFALADGGASPDLLTAWRGALAYTLQLYFDFSGYSDMAIGAARLFGIVLPLNFASPYKARNIAEFWRRWHMTLSRFLRDYLYIALGGNRQGAVRRYANLFTTMLLGGLWHGAGWTFVLWGALHGAFLVVHRLWQRLKLPLPATAAWALTFFAVVFAWVPFRAETLAGAGQIVAGMVGFNGVALPAAAGAAIGPLRAAAEGVGVAFTLGGGSAFVAGWLWIFGLLALALAAPNTQELLASHRPGLGFEARACVGRLHWLPSRRWALATAVLATAGTLALARASEFLYFQF